MEKIIEIVRKYNFESNLHPGFSKVNSLIQSKEFDSIPNIVGTLLTTINDRLSQVTGKEKEILEFLSSELFCEQIRILNSSEDGKLCWQKCLPILKDTCDVKGYDFEALSKLLKFEFIKTLAPKSIVDERVFPFYEMMRHRIK